MTESIAIYLRDSEPVDDVGGGASLSEKSPSVPPKPSLLGAASQYQHAPRLPVVNNSTSVTGATLDDPTGECHRQEVLKTPDWDTPFSGFKQAFSDYGTSILVFWISTGLSFSLVLMLGRFFYSGSAVNWPSPTMAMFCAPGYGLYQNFLHGAPGVLFSLVEFPIAFAQLLSTQWPARLKYGIAMMVVVALNAVVLGLTR